MLFFVLKTKALSLIDATYKSQKNFDTLKYLRVYQKNQRFWLQKSSRNDETSLFLNMTSSK
jgi:hypothetical protein